MKKTFKLRNLLAFSSLLLIPTASSVAGSFTITGPVGAAQNLNPVSGSQTGVVTSTGLLTGSGANTAVTFSGANGTSATLTNSGTIRQTGTSLALSGTTAGVDLTVTNNASAIIRSSRNDTFRMGADSAIALDNSGTIQSLNVAGGSNEAIDWTAISSKANTLHNFSTGQILSSAADAVRLGVNGSVTNDQGGVIRATPVVAATLATDSDGIDTLTNSGVSVNNSGSIEGRHGITGGNGASAYTMSVTNGATGTISGVNGSGINISGSGSTTTVTNSGTISGTWDSTKYSVGDGDGIAVNGLLNLTNNNIIRGLGSSSANQAQGVVLSGGTITNNSGAEISGNVIAGGSTTSQGIRVSSVAGGGASASATITNSGTIRGYQGAGIQTVGTFDNSITNNAGGTIRGAGSNGAILTDSGNDTVTNKGSIVGDAGQAIDLGAGNNTLTVQGGAASIQGNVSGGVGGSNTLNLNIGASNTFSYTGVFSNFTDVQVNGGQTTLSGANTYLGTTTVNSGVLLVENSSGSATGTGAVDIKNGATLGGSGFITGNLTVESGGILSPGAANGVDILDVASVLLSNNSTFAVNLDPTNSLGQGITDVLNVTGSVSLNQSNIFVNLLSAPTLGQTFDILLNDGNDLITGFFNQGNYLTASFSSISYLFLIDYGYNADGGAVGNDIRLTQVQPVVNVPEPSLGMLFSLGAFYGVFRRRFSKDGLTKLIKSV